MNQLTFIAEFGAYLFGSLVGIMIASTCLWAMGTILSRMFANRSAAHRSWIWRMVCASMVLSSLALLSLPGIPVSSAWTNRLNAITPNRVDRHHSDVQNTNSLVVENQTIQDPSFQPIPLDAAPLRTDLKAESPGAGQMIRSPSRLDLSNVNIEYARLLFIGIWSGGVALVTLRFALSVLFANRMVRQASEVRSTTIKRAFDSAKRRLNFPSTKAVRLY